MSTSLRTLSAEILETLIQPSLTEGHFLFHPTGNTGGRMGFKIESGSDLMVPCFLGLPVLPASRSPLSKTGDQQMLCFLIMFGREERGPLPDRGSGSSLAPVKLVAGVCVEGSNIHWVSSATWDDILPPNLALSLFLHPPQQIHEIANIFY